MGIVSTITRELISLNCLACNKPAEPGAEHSFCEDCLRELPMLHPPLCPGCGGELDGVLELCLNCLRESERPWDHAFAVMRFEGLARKLLHRFKYEDRPELAAPFAELAVDVLKKNTFRPDLITPMPLHWTKTFSRGFNQSDLLAKEMSTRLGIPSLKTIKRHKRTQAQAHLSKIERRNNIIDAFSMKNAAICENRDILIIDDVLTTGATLVAAAAVLLKCDAKSVNILVLARGY